MRCFGPINESSLTSEDEDLDFHDLTWTVMRL
jgi:hypothetical protein